MNFNMFGIADLRSVNFIDAQIVPFLAFLIWLLIPFNVTLLIFIGLLLPIYEDVAGSPDMLLSQIWSQSFL